MGNKQNAYTNLIFVLALFAVLIFAVPVMAEAGEDTPAEWTVMFYLCGSDLESRYGYAAENLEEIAQCHSYEALYHLMRQDGTEPAAAVPGVNVVLQTGGCKEWHTRDLGMDADPSALQRWRFQPETVDSIGEGSSFVLEDTLPLASMAAPETLADFIRWTAEKYPANKYALVLWDHGGGSKTGIFIDELFDGDTLYLDELNNAFAQGGVTFEAVLFDACMMANVETACAIKDNANWMIASEEVAAGEGTAIDDWLQQLYITPQWDGQRLGRWICDMTQVKYANENDSQSQELITWSVIDLSRIDRVAAAFDRFFEVCGYVYANDPLQMVTYASFLWGSVELGSGQENLFDMADIFYSNQVLSMMDADLYQELLDSLADAVPYTVRGSGRSAAKGLSFCYASDFNEQELEIYARNCPFAHYLALLDAISPTWTAPEWVYEVTDPLPDIEDIESYHIQVAKRISSDGTPGISIESGLPNVGKIYVTLYRKDEETGKNLRLGTTVPFPDESSIEDDTVYAIYQFWMWPAVEGVYCDAEMIGMDRNGYLISIPVRMDTENGFLRCGYDNESESYSIYGQWEGYDADSEVFNRNVKSLAQLSGQEFSLLYPIDGTEDTGYRFEKSESMTVYRGLMIEEMPLPAGDYMLEYTVEDMLMRRLPVGRVEIHWDTETLSLPSGAWEGTVDLMVPRQ